jgi:hypothetical protein
MSVGPGRPPRGAVFAFVLVLYALLVAADPYIHALTAGSAHREANCVVCAASKAPSEIQLSSAAPTPNTAPAGDVFPVVPLFPHLLLGVRSIGRSPPA